MDPDNGLPAFSQSKNEIWVMLLEKAFAKVNGCYEHASFGLSYEGF